MAGCAHAARHCHRHARSVFSTARGLLPPAGARHRFRLPVLGSVLAALHSGRTMARIEVPMPQMGESIAEGTVSKWIKKVGDAVGRDEPLLEISTDKVDAEIPSPSAGTLVEVVVNEGQTVEVGTVLGYIDTEKSAAAAPEPKKETPAPAAKAAEPARAEQKG